MRDEPWRPRVVPPIGVDLSDTQALACSFRILAAGGFSENMGGHITMLAGTGGEMWINPWGLWWDELTSSDLCRIAPDGEVLEGRWDVTPAVHIHTELHRLRPDAAVVVHNHPYYVTVLTALGMLPEVLHQTGCVFDGEMVFVDEYGGEIDESSLGADLACHIGKANVALLVNHGAIVIGETVEQATYRAAVLERQCRLTYDVLMASAAGAHGRQIEPAFRGPMKAALDERAASIYWAGRVRKLFARCTGGVAVIIEVRPGVPSTVAMREHDEFRQFYVAVVGRAAFGEVRQALACHDVEIVGGHAWVPEDAIVALAGAEQPETWREGLDAMIRYAQENGWVDDSGRVRAHIEPSKG